MVFYTNEVRTVVLAALLASHSTFTWAAEQQQQRQQSQQTHVRRVQSQSQSQSQSQPQAQSQSQAHRKEGQAITNQEGVGVATTHGRVIGGSDAPANEYPWYTRGVLGTTDSWWGCGGSLITPEFVITAAHCGYDTTSGFQIGALCDPFGDDPDSNCGQESETFSVVQTWNHPLYNTFGTNYDFTLAKLSGRSSIPPVPIDEGTLSTSYTGGEPLWVIGVGNNVGTSTGYYPDHLQHAEIAYTTNEMCSWGGSLEDNMMCAGGGGEGGCYGDSGGPLYDKVNNALVGIVSWGSFPCGPTETVFARIADQWEDWIKPNICDNHSKPVPVFCIEEPTVSPIPTPSPTTARPTFTPAPTFVDSGPYKVIDNDVIMLGVHKEGHLNVPGPPDAHAGITTVGLRYYRSGGWYDSTSFGAPAEGFGVSGQVVDGNAFWGGANKNWGIDNLSDSVMTATDRVATARATVDNRIRVTHEYKPSPETENLYQVAITYKNLDTNPITDLRYRRVMDWDIPPRIFYECVSIFFPAVPDSIEELTDDGFALSNPTSAATSLYFSCPDGVGCPEYDNGPVDHGALFQFHFKTSSGPITLAPGDEFTFDMFYGAADNKNDAYDALVAVGAEIASYGYSPSGDTCSSSVDGSPQVFMMGFRGVGGVPFTADDDGGGSGDDAVGDDGSGDDGSGDDGSGDDGSGDDGVGDDGGVDDDGEECPSSKSSFTLELKTDMFGEDISWEVEEYMTDGTWGRVLTNMREYRDRQRYKEDYCLQKGSCYKFTITDKYGDGLCCDWGEGYYKIKYDGELLRMSPFEDKEKASRKFGLCEEVGMEEES